MEKREGFIPGFKEDRSFTLGSKDLDATPRGHPGLKLSTLSQTQRDRACVTHSSEAPKETDGGARRGEEGVLNGTELQFGRMEGSGEGGGDGCTTA